MWEIDASQPDNDMLISISKFFNVSVDYLLGCSDLSNTNIKTESHQMNGHKDDFINRISELRKQHGYSQVSLGKAINRAQNTICNWENGNREPDIESLILLSSLFGVSIDYLLGKTNTTPSINTEISNSKIFSENLKKLRQSKGVYQKDIANWLKIDRTTYVKYERGQSTPDYNILLKLADYFSVSVDYLLGHSDSQVLNTRNETDKRLESIIENYQKLNDAGKDDLAKHAEHLTYIPEYKKGDSTTSEKSKIG